MLQRVQPSAASLSIPVFIGHGTLDQLIPSNMANNSEQTLQRLGELLKIWQTCSQCMAAFLTITKPWSGLVTDYNSMQRRFLCIRMPLCKASSWSHHDAAKGGGMA